MDGSRIKEEITGILASLAGLLIVISLVSHNPWDQSVTTQSPELENLLGSFGSNMSDILIQGIGYGAYIIPAVLIFYGLRKILGKAPRLSRLVFAGALFFLLLSAASLLTLLMGPYAGGAAGIFSTTITLKTISSLGSYLLFFSLLLVSLMYLFQFSLVSMLTSTRSRISRGSQALATIRARRKLQPRPEEKKVPYIPEDTFEEHGVPEQEDLPLTAPEIKARPVLKKASKLPKKEPGEYELPGIDLLIDSPPSKSRPSKGELLERSDLLEKKLLDYSIVGKVTYVSPGPIVTMFEFEPAPGVKISKIMSLADDLAMALRATSVRISPIHGRSTLGIEIPNKDREDVVLKDIIANEAFQKSYSKLSLALGKDIFGIPVVTDLGKMPHLHIKII